MRRLGFFKNFSIAAWLTLLFCLGLLLGSSLTVLYRFNLPTDGWYMVTTEIDSPDWIYWQNLVGAPSELKKEDRLVVIEGQDLRGTASVASLSPPENWQVGESVSMVVQRGSATLQFEVPVVNWTIAAWWGALTLDLSNLFAQLGALILLVVGTYSFWRRSDLVSARALFVFCTANAAATISSSLPDGISVQFNPLAYQLTSFFSYAIIGTVMMPAILTFTLYFPRPKKILTHHPIIGIIPMMLGALLFFALQLGLPAEFAWAAALGMVVTAILSLVQAWFTQKDAVSRAQLRWAVGGFAAGLGLVLLVYPVAFGFITDLFWVELLSGSAPSLGIVVIGLCLGIAVTRYRLFDIDIIIRKTLLYGTLTLTLATVYFGSVILLQSVFGSLFDIEDSPFTVVISTLIIAALFNPLRSRLQDFIDRRFFRQKYDAEQALQSFAQTAQNLVELEGLIAAFGQVIQETLQPATAILWLQPPNKAQKLPPEAYE